MKVKKLKTKIIPAAVIILIMAPLLLVFTFSGCKNAPSESALSSSKSSSTITSAESSVETNKTLSPETTAAKEEQTPIEVTDGMGGKVILEKPAEKVVVLAPSVLEIFDGLGAMDKVVEVDSFSVQINEPLAKGFKGAGDANGLNFETITKLNPDLIILVGFGPGNDYKKLSELGFKIYMSNSASLEDTYNEIINIGKLIGKSQEAEQLSNNLKEQVSEIYEKVKEIPEDKRPTVFYMVWNDPIMSAGKNTFINDLIEKAGGINIVSRDGLSDWPEYSLEKIIENNPDIIIAPVSLAPTPDTIINDERFVTIKAVINKNVYIIPDNPISRPNQNVIKGLKMLSKAIHPEIFGEFEIIN